MNTIYTARRDSVGDWGVYGPDGNWLNLGSIRMSEQLARAFAGALTVGLQEQAKQDMYLGPRQEMGS